VRRSTRRVKIVTMIDWTAIAALATVFLGAATLYLGMQARRQSDASQDADRARQREAHILAVRPLLVREPSLSASPAGASLATVKTVVGGEFPVLNLNVTIRGRGQAGDDVAVSADRGSLAPGIEDHAILELLRFADMSTTRTWGPGLEVVLTYHGLLGQWVVEHYEWLLNARREGRPRAWRLYRFEVEPRGVPGASSLDLRFGAPPAYS